MIDFFKKKVMVGRVWRETHFHTTSSSMSAQKHTAGKQLGVYAGYFGNLTKS